MSQEFLNAIDAKPRYATEVKRLHLPRQLRKGGRVNFIWTLVTFGLLAFEWPLGLISAAAQASWALWTARSPLGLARKDFMLGNHAAYAGKHREALSYFKSSLKEFPDMMEVQLILGDIYFKLGDRRKGIEAYEDYLSQNPQDQVARIKLLFILMDEGLYQEFLALLEGLPQELLQDFLLSILKAYALLLLGKPGQAAKVLEEIPEAELEGEGKEVPLNYLWGKIYLQQREPARAREHLEQVVEAREDFLDAKKLLRQSR